MSALPPLPACLTVEEVARLLGFARHAIPVLARAGLLQPIGNGRRNTVKFYLRDAVLARCSDERWLAQAVDAIREHWHRKNRRRREIVRSRPPNPDNHIPFP